MLLFILNLFGKSGKLFLEKTHFTCEEPFLKRISQNDGNSPPKISLIYMIK
jgi:hypothetical protein